MMRMLVVPGLALALTTSLPPQRTPQPGWTLVWQDEFDADGLPDPERWG
jgi:hypothetical protein